MTNTHTHTLTLPLIHMGLKHVTVGHLSSVYEIWLTLFSQKHDIIAKELPIGSDTHGSCLFSTYTHPSKVIA